MAIKCSHEETTREARETIRTLFSLIDAQGKSDYIGENVSQLEHSLQAAALAAEAGSNEETILAALLHDIGRFIPAAKDMPEMIAADGTYVGNKSHEVLGEKYLKGLGFGQNLCEIVGAHVWAKRYLCAVEAGYWEALSRSSKITLQFQGGPFDKNQVTLARKDPLLEYKLSVRRWDDMAKVPKAIVPGLEAYEGMAIRCLIEGQKV